MMRYILLIPPVLSFLIAILFIPKWIKKCKQINLLWEDMNKPNHQRNIAGSGGVIIVMAFIFGVLSYVAIRTFVYNAAINGINVEIFALSTTVILMAFIGLIDDLFGWRSKGISRRFRILLVLFSAIPLMVINAGIHTISVPFFGAVDFGLIYPLFFIPLGIVGSTVTFNFLAGFNGLEAGQGILVLSFLSFVAYVNGSPWLFVIGLCMIAALLVFYLYNKYPAKIFPGDALTYPVGVLIGVMAILGNFEKIAVFVFIPYILEFFLKLRGKLEKHSFGKPNKDGSLELPYNKVYGLTHLSIWILKKIKKKVYEKDVTYLILIFQIVIILLALILFKESLL